MFTIDQIKAAHTKVKSGTDFPAYIQALKLLGVTAYETWVADGSTLYFSSNQQQLNSPPKYNPLIIAAKSDTAQFIQILKKPSAGPNRLYYLLHTMRRNRH